jgi:hypothetical protein
MFCFFPNLVTKIFLYISLIFKKYVTFQILQNYAISAIRQLGTISVSGTVPPATAVSNGDRGQFIFLKL